MSTHTHTHTGDVFLSLLAIITLISTNCMIYRNTLSLTHTHTHTHTSIHKHAIFHIITLISHYHTFTFSLELQ